MGLVVRTPCHTTPVQHGPVVSDPPRHFPLIGRDSEYVNIPSGLQPRILPLLELISSCCVGGRKAKATPTPPPPPPNLPDLLEEHVWQLQVLFSGHDNVKRVPLSTRSILTY